MIKLTKFIKVQIHASFIIIGMLAIKKTIHTNKIKIYFISTLFRKNFECI